MCKGTAKSDIVSLSQTVCPHSADPSEPTGTGGGMIAWKFKSSDGDNAIWKNAKEDGLLAMPSE